MVRLKHSEDEWTALLQCGEEGWMIRLCHSIKEMAEDGWLTFPLFADIKNRKGTNIVGFLPKRWHILPLAKTNDLSFLTVGHICQLIAALYLFQSYRLSTLIRLLWRSFVSVQKVVSVWVQVSLRLKPRLVANRKFAWEINDSKNSIHKELLSYKPKQKVISKAVESLCSSLSTVPCACHVCLKPIWCFDGTKSCNPTSNLLDS